MRFYHLDERKKDFMPVNVFVFWKIKFIAHVIFLVRLENVDFVSTLVYASQQQEQQPLFVSLSVRLGP